MAVRSAARVVRARLKDSYLGVPLTTNYFTLGNASDKKAGRGAGAQPRPDLAIVTGLRFRISTYVRAIYDNIQ
jgi:hypothetical protein